MIPVRASCLLLLGIAAWLSASCSRVPDSEASAMARTATFQAIDTLAASTRQVLATSLAAPTGTGTTFDDVATIGLATVEPSATATPVEVWIEVRVDTNCRLGPGVDFEMVGALLVGERTRVLKRSTVPDYWVVDNPDNPGRACYLWGKYATLEGDLGSLPLDIPPSPTPVPASIAGWSYWDRNDNGQRDPAESGEIVSYARFSLKLGACPGGETLRRVESNAYGRFFIPNLLNGTYCLVPDVRSPALLPEQYQIELSPNQPLDDINFRILP